MRGEGPARKSGLGRVAKPKGRRVPKVRPGSTGLAIIRRREALSAVRCSGTLITAKSRTGRAGRI